MIQETEDDDIEMNKYDEHDTQPTLSFRERLETNYEFTFLLFCLFQNFAGGFVYGARGLCIIYMQKEYFRLEPSDI